jgi:hypothetical protein
VTTPRSWDFFIAHSAVVEGVLHVAVHKDDLLQVVPHNLEV